MGRQLIGEDDLFLWLPGGDLKGETESEVTAAKDQALQTKCHATKLLDRNREQMQILSIIL
jgi:hypothetical protein